MERKQLFVLLIQNFNKKLFESLNPFDTIEDKVDYLETLAVFLQGSSSFDGDSFNTNEFVRKNILLKYKHKAKPFLDLNLRFYFEKDETLRELLFNILKIEEEILNQDELREYFTALGFILNNVIAKICTQDVEAAKVETDKEIKSLPETNAGIINAYKASNGEYTRIRQALMLHFWFEAIGLDKDHLKRRKLAEFGHAIFLWPFDEIDNSGLYKMLRQAPLIKENDRSMIKDLEFVKRQFQLVNIPGAVELIEMQIKSLKN